MAFSSVLTIMCGLLRDGVNKHGFFFSLFSFVCNIMRWIDESGGLWTGDDV